MNGQQVDLAGITATFAETVARLQRCPVVQAYLIGSATTGEFNAATGTSDLDFLAIMGEGTSDEECAVLKQELRWSLEKKLDGRKVGLRCRYPPELPAFSRYLALQGYHASFACPLIGKNAFRLPDFSNHPATAEEYACILGECLWAELRAPDDASALSAVSEYLQAKSLLAYVNLLLVSDGSFLPTHAARVAHWNLTSCDALTVPASVFQSRQVTGSRLDGNEVKELCKRLRDRAMARAREFSPRQGYTGQPDFWATPWEAEGREIENGLEICEALFALLNGLPAITASSSAGRFSSFLRSLVTLPSREVVSRIHGYRITHSRDSRRDWGHISIAGLWTDQCAPAIQNGGRTDLQGEPR